MNWASKIGNILSGGFLDRVLDFIPKPGEKARARAAIELELMRELQSHEDKFREFVIEYEGRGAEMHWSIQILRSVIRPGITVWAFALLNWVAYRYMTDPAITEQSLVVFKLVALLNFLTLAFWFGEKALVRSGLGDGLKTWLGRGG